MEHNLGSSFAKAARQGQMVVVANLNTQAYIQGIDDDFFIATLITIIGVFPVIFLVVKKKKKLKLKPRRTMNKLRFIFILRIIIVLGIVCNLHVYGQTNTNKNSNTVSGDSLTLAKIISTVVQTHPSVKEMIEAITSADAGVGMAKSGYYPNADAEASYTRLGPASELTIPHLGSFSLYPVNNYSVSVSAAREYL